MLVLQILEIFAGQIMYEDCSRTLMIHRTDAIQVYTVPEQLSPLNPQIIILGDEALQRKSQTEMWGYIDKTSVWLDISLWTQLLALTSSKVCLKHDSKVSQFLLSIHLSFSLSHSPYLTASSILISILSLPYLESSHHLFMLPFLFKCSFFQPIASKHSPVLANLINLS